MRSKTELPGPSRRALPIKIWRHPSRVGRHYATLREWTSEVTLTRVQHPSGIPEKIVRKVVTRRGRLHAFETIEPQSTALVVIDLDAATVRGDPAAKAMIPTVNRLALTVRRAGGVVAWVRSRMDKMPRHFAAILGDELAAKYFNDGHAGGPGTALWHELHSDPTDIFAVKSGASAFFPGKCDLKEQLDARRIDTILISYLWRRSTERGDRDALGRSLRCNADRSRSTA